MIQSADGHHRCFDEKAIGSVFGDGAGVVLLKRLEDAAADKDTIYAIIKGSALNNDGNRKLGYLAPSVEGQTEVIRRAQQMARVEPESIGYIETHGSATPLGDVVEIEALTQVFNKVNTGKKQWCPMGSVKANVGHPNIAAGITGFIKTVLVLKHRLIPPHINFENPNSRIDFENTPFYVNTRLKEWKSKGYPFRAGVCSFGIGGTNAYVILEEPPAMEPLPETRNRKLLMLSAKTPISLDQAGKNLLNFLKENPTVNLSDAAYTLQVGRKHFQFREMLVCSNRDEAVEILSSREPGKISRFDSKGERPDVIFLFPGLGSQYVNMGMGLYRDERVFREQMDRFFSIYCSITGDDIREILYPAAPPGGSTANTEREDLQQPGISQPVIFMFEYSLAKLLMSWGIIPSEMLGYSFGEYTAACISGVISPEDALGLIILRGRLMARLPKGAMTSVPLPFNQLEPIMDSRLSIAVDNGPSCIVGGAGEAIDEFEQAMKGKGYLCIRVNVPHAAHSPEMTPILAEFAEAVRKIELKDPQIPYISNVTGKRAIAAQVKSHQYWVTHLAETVRFGPGLNRLLKQPGTVFVEMGPGRDLSVLAKVQKEYTSSNRFVNLVRHWKEQWDDNHYLLNRLGLLWLYGVEIDWRKFYANEKRYRIPLPSYPFEGRYYWPDGNPSRVTGIQNVGKPELKKQKNVSDWFYIPVWKQSAPVIPGNRKSTGKIHWMVAVGECSFAKRLLERLLVEERDVITVKAGHEFVKESDSVYTIRPGKREDYKTLFNHLHDGAGLPDRIVFLWGVDREECNPRQLEPGDFEKAQEKIFYSLVYMVQALSGIEGGKPTRIIVVNNGLHQVTGKEILAPHKATVLGAVTCINHEFKEISCQSVDIALPGEGSPDEEELVGQLLAEFRWESREMVTAYRGPYRWERRFDKVKWEGDGIDTPSCQLRKKGTYLIVGGLGEIGFILAKELTVQLGAKLILTGRTIHTDEKQEKLRELENSGAEVLVFEADAANRQQMEEVVRVSEERLGPIKGVIHAAGILGDEMFRTVNELDKEHCRKHFEAKVHGVLNLAAIFQGRDLDFCLLMSSVASTLGGMGMTAYSAANLFMDAYALSKKRDNGVHWLSAGWDRWQSNGTNRQSDFINGVMGDLLITEEEGTRAFHGILSPGIGNLIIISTGHFETRVNQWAKIKKRKERKIPGDSSARAPLSSWSRVGFLTAYAEPQNQVEQIITDLMKNYFGFEQIGIDDNFFDLGATSLDLVQLNSKLNAVWSQKIPLVKLLTYTSIRTLAHYIMEEVISNRPLNKEIDRSDVFKRGQRNIEEKLKIRRNKT
jgi:acyl transferase domain-containing protein/acyl carrier protein